MKQHDETLLPIWAQKQLNDLRNTIQGLESYRKLHAVLSDKDRDWFTLPDPFKGCHKEVMHLWFLTEDKPQPICTLFKGDMLFIGRATKERYGHRLVEPELTKEVKLSKRAGEPVNIGAIIDQGT